MLLRRIRRSYCAIERKRVKIKKDFIWNNNVTFNVVKWQKENCICSSLCCINCGNKDSMHAWNSFLLRLLLSLLLLMSLIWTLCRYRCCCCCCFRHYFTNLFIFSLLIHTTFYHSFKNVCFNIYSIVTHYFHVFQSHVKRNILNGWWIHNKILNSAKHNSKPHW